MDGLMSDSGEYLHSIQPKQAGSLSNKSDGDSTGKDKAMPTIAVLLELVLLPPLQKVMLPLWRVQGRHLF